MLVIDFLYKMRRYLKKYVEDFYPSDIGEYHYWLNKHNYLLTYYKLILKQMEDK